MEGLLEPKGELAQVYGKNIVKTQVNRLCDAFRIILEKSLSNSKQFYGGKYPADGLQKAIDKSNRLIKEKFWRKMPAQNSLGHAWLSTF